MPARGYSFLILLVAVLGLAGCERIDKSMEARAARPPTAARSPLKAREAMTYVRRPALPALATPQYGARSVELGRSVMGTPLTLHTFGASPSPLLIIGGIHGDEPTAAFVAERFLEQLRADPSQARGGVAILAVANPDGLATGSRGNARGVDLNRNFSASNWKLNSPGSRYHGGPRPESEPETQAMARAILQTRPRAIIALHSISGGRECNNYDGPAGALAEHMAGFNGYPPKASIGYPTPGSLGSWAGQDMGIPTITLELPSAASGPTSWERNRSALLAAIDGPRTALGQ
ncbi:MAG: DUF2817 domain-containing protein [Phycisphaerales bacterium]|nr:DUF2817 domain-containing protein [Phycisphaerales bacterium]